MLENLNFVVRYANIETGKSRRGMKMKILHTSDWHLGKKLEGAKRIEEQKLFIDTLEKIVTDKKFQSLS